MKNVPPLLYLDPSGSLMFHLMVLSDLGWITKYTKWVVHGGPAQGTILLD